MQTGETGKEQSRDKNVPLHSVNNEVNLKHSVNINVWSVKRFHKPNKHCNHYFGQTLVLGVIRVTPGKAAAQGAHMRGKLKGNLKESSRRWRVGEHTVWISQLSPLLSGVLFFFLSSLARSMFPRWACWVSANLSCHPFPLIYVLCLCCLPQWVKE